nr:hypothetical protein [Candidatus Woesearchaeota archaeon]
MKQIRKKLASRVSVYTRKERPGKKTCANCSKVLPGILNFKTSKIRNIARTRKRPSRKFGGYLCSRCSRKMILQGVRK